MQQSTLSISYKIYDHFENLPIEDQNLINQAQDACKYAYAPYSKFKVGATILTESNRIIQGANHENAAYPCGICAERAALNHYQMIAANEKIIAIAVTTERTLIKTAFPCGFCRQVMNETEINNGAPIRLVVAQKNEKSYVFDACSDLLPFGFHPELLLPAG